MMLGLVSDEYRLATVRFGLLNLRRELLVLPLLMVGRAAGGRIRVAAARFQGWTT